MILKVFLMEKQIFSLGEGSKLISFSIIFPNPSSSHVMTGSPPHLERLKSKWVGETDSPPQSQSSWISYFLYFVIQLDFLGQVR